LLAVLLLSTTVLPPVAGAEQPPLSVLIREPLVLQGMAQQPIANRPGNEHSAKRVRLLRVVPLRQLENDPFNDTSLPLAIGNARIRSDFPAGTPTTPDTPPPTPPAPPPVAGSCPEDMALTVSAMLPAGLPLAQEISISSTPPYQLDVGMGGLSQAINIALLNPGNDTQGVVTIGSGFTYLSGSSTGTVSEGSGLTYLLRRNTDSAEFEISLRFSVGIVFDDMGITIEALSGRLCQSGGPL
jgi:hypothetical protein